MENWDDEFISRFVEHNIILSLSNHSEYKSYIHDLSQINLKNDIYATILYCKKLQSCLFSKCVISNIDGTCHYRILKLISIVHNLTNDNVKVTELLIIYNANDHYTSFNDW